jgi:molybdopterin-guanine dinucleotide biosynthesis protein A
MSSRMGEAKALLDWHGTPLVCRVAGLLSRVCAPVIVAAAADQELPLPRGVERATDAAPGRGPLEGIAAGMHALAGRAGAVFLAATDLALLHPAFVAGLLDALPGYDVAVPVLGGHDQTLAAAYDAGVLRRASELLAAGRPRVAALLDGARVHRLGPADLDEPDSVRSVNTRAEYAELRALPQPLVTVVAAGRPAVQVEAATLGAAIGIAWPVDPPPRVVATVNGARLGVDPGLPLVRGDVVELRVAGAEA